MIIIEKGVELGAWVVVGRDGRTARREARWLCECMTCGEQVTKTACNIRVQIQRRYPNRCPVCVASGVHRGEVAESRQRAGKYCRLCCHQSWRVHGETCAECGTVAGPERRPERPEALQSCTGGNVRGGVL